jgi:hypothetical protein
MGFGSMKSKLGKGAGPGKIASGMKGSIPGSGKRGPIKTLFKQASQISGKR